MRKRLLLVTHGYPFGESERSFLTEEVKILSEQFELVIMALENKDELIYPTDGITHIERYRFSSFRKSRAYRALPRVFELSTLREARSFAKAYGFSDPIRKLRRILYYRFNVWEMEQQIGELVQLKGIDLVYTYWCNECTVAAVKLKKRFPHLKVVTRFHGVDLYQERALDGWQPFRKEIARRSDGLCFACEYGRTYFREHWGAKCEEKMRVHYLGSTDRGVVEAPVTDTLRLVSCSNLVALKRVELIVEALSLLPKSVKVQWWHFGDGPERKRLEELAQNSFGKCPNIQWGFCGFVPNAALTVEYRKNRPNLFVTTSSTEGGAPVSIQEAFSMGIPAIGTPVGGIPDLIADEKTGFLLPEQMKAEDLADAIMKYLAMPEEAKKQMAAEARKLWKEKFDARANAAGFVEYLLKLISE